MLLLYVEPEGTQMDLVRITCLFDIAYTLGMYIFLSTSRKTVDESEVSFLDSLGGNLEIFLRPVWYIVLGVRRRIVVLVGIDAEHGEISGVTWPHPVVCVASEFAYG